MSATNEGSESNYDIAPSADTNLPGNGRTTPVESIDNANVDVVPDEASEKEKEDIESRQQRISSDLLEQKHNFQGVLFNFVGFVILALYVLLILCLYYLALSRLPFEQSFPTSGLIFLGIVAAVPTLLSVFLMTGLFSKDSAKEDKPTPFDFSLISKAALELVKQLKSM